MTPGREAGGEIHNWRHQNCTAKQIEILSASNIVPAQAIARIQAGNLPTTTKKNSGIHRGIRSIQSLLKKLMRLQTAHRVLHPKTIAGDFDRLLAS